MSHYGAHFTHILFATPPACNKIYCYLFVVYFKGTKCVLSKVHVTLGASPEWNIRIVTWLGARSVASDLLHARWSLWSDHKYVTSEAKAYKGSGLSSCCGFLQLGTIITFTIQWINYYSEQNKQVCTRHFMHAQDTSCMHKTYNKTIKAWFRV